MVSARKTAAQRYNQLRRWNDDDDPKVVAAGRDLRAAALADYVERAVNEAPPLTPEQRAKIAALLRGGGDAAA